MQDPMRDGNDLPALARQLETELNELQAKLAAAEADADRLARALENTRKEIKNSLPFPSTATNQILVALAAHEARKGGKEL